MYNPPPLESRLKKVIEIFLDAFIFDSTTCFYVWPAYIQSQRFKKNLELRK